MNIEKIKKVVNKSLDNNDFPCCAVGVYNNKKKYSFVKGYLSYRKNELVNEKTLFDLASLSKPLATTLSCLSLIQEDKINYKMKLDELLGCTVPEDKKNINLSQLLSHSAGFVAHQEFYKTLELIPFEKRKETLLSEILNLPLSYQPEVKSIYSDLGFIILFLIIEFQAKISFENYVYKHIFEPMGIKDICYNPIEKGYTNFAATEKCEWRNKELKGCVHDQNTSVLNGVSGQAGLFGPIDSVLDIVIYIKDIILGNREHPSFKSKLLKEAVTRRTKPESTSWGLGFDTPSQPGSSAGKFISEKSCGHLGFTGTSFWIDFEKDSVAVLLTNRINPSVDNINIRDFRPVFHDLVFGP